VHILSMKLRVMVSSRPIGQEDLSITTGHGIDSHRYEVLGAPSLTCNI
jgi:hypothetical protein